METMEKEKSRRGAPPRPEVIARDKLVMEYLTEHGPMTRNALSDALGIERRLLWLALDRLRRRGELRMCAQPRGVKGDPLWSAAVGEPCA
jgi:hypothetical protein